MLDYSTTVVSGDTTGPEYKGITANNAQRLVIISFSEALDPATATNPSNYLIEFDGVLRQLPSDVQISLTQDGKAVQLIFPQFIDNKAVTISGGVGVTTPTLTKIQVSGIKDVAGNILANSVGTPIFTTGLLAIAESAANAVSAEQTDRNTIKVVFNQPIGVANRTDFVIHDGGTIVPVDSVTVNGTTDVILTTSSANKLTTASANIAVDVVAGNAIKTASGNSVLPTGGTPIVPADKVGPAVIANAADRTNGVYKLTFTEDLDTSLAAHFAEGIEVVKITGTVDPLNTNQYTVTASASGAGHTSDVLEISITGLDNNARYTVKVKDQSPYLLDAAGNKVSGSDTYDFIGIALDNVPATAATITGANGGIANSIDAGDKITIKFSEPVVVSNITLANITVGSSHTFGTNASIAAVGASGGFADTFVITLGAGTDLAAGDTLTIAGANVVDAAGNSSATPVVFTVPAATNF
jgi:hypothetical protein